MSFMAKWLTMVVPILDRAIAIIPHLKEIINIAFKPFNGQDMLDEHDEMHFRNRIKFIDQKLFFVNPIVSESNLLDSKARTRIIKRYNEDMKKIEWALINEFICPALVQLSKQEESIFDVKDNSFFNHFSDELEQSLLLPDKEFSIDPLKKSIMRDIERGFDQIMNIHPRRGIALADFRTWYQDEKVELARTKGNFSTIVKTNYRILDLMGLMNYLWNKMGLRKDHFLTQFYFYVTSTYELAYTFTCFELYQQDKGRTLSLVMDKLIMEVSLMIKLLNNTSVLDPFLFEFFYPEEPHSKEITKIREKEAEIMIANDLKIDNFILSNPRLMTRNPPPPRSLTGGPVMFDNNGFPIFRN